MLESYVRAKSAILNESPPTMEQPIFSSGLLDSLDFAELLSFIAETFGVDLWSRGDISPEEVDTLEAMVSLIQQEQQLAAAC